MKALILAAGRGERLRPLTDHTPKPLLRAGGRCLIEYTIESLVDAGFTELVINLAHLGHKIETALGDGRQFDANVSYSHEGDTALETAGGIIHALPLLGDQPFLVVNGDIATDFPYRKLIVSPVGLAHIVLVPNPAHHADGDFALTNGAIRDQGEPRYTFSGIGVYDPKLFASLPPGKHPLAPLLREAAELGQVSGELYRGFWMDIGTPQRLQELDNLLCDTQKRRQP